MVYGLIHKIGGVLIGEKIKVPLYLNGHLMDRNYYRMIKSFNRDKKCRLKFHDLKPRHQF